MPESFGARLRQQREARQIDLVAIAEQTKIKFALLEALEHDDLSHWPSGIFRRAYIRAYAQFIGLDPDVVLREFLEVHPDPADVLISTAAAAAAAEEEYAKHAPSMRFRNIVGSALGSLTRLRRPAVEESQPIAAPESVPTSGGISPAPFEDAPLSAPAGFDADLELAPELVQQQTAEPRVETVECGPMAEVEAQSAEVVVVADAAPEPLEPEPPAVAPQPAAATASVAENAAIREAYEAALERVAQICTDFGRVIERGAVRDLLQQSAEALSAAGLIVWLADEVGETLRPGLVHGYPDRVLAQLPTVMRDADNATAAAFRSRKPCDVAATLHTSGALVVPMLVPDGCAGVLAIELQQGVRPDRSLQAVAILLAAALTQLVHRSRPTERPAPAETPAQAVAQFRPAARPMKVRR
jgi:cytoskeletal protein RodZ